METQTELTEQELIKSIKEAAELLRVKHRQNIQVVIKNKIPKKIDYIKLNKWLVENFSEVYERRRTPELVSKRASIFYLLYSGRDNYSNIRLKKLAPFFNMNHTTIIYHLKKVDIWKMVSGYEKELEWQKQITSELEPLFNTGYFDVKI